MPSQISTGACLKCGIGFTYNPVQSAGKYCSPACANKTRGSLEARFQLKVDRTRDCWHWTGATIRSGYGIIRAGGSDHRMLYAHRVAFEVASGEPIPDGLEVLHTCDDPPCVRNDDEGIYEVGSVVRPRWGHLWLGTQGDNVLDMFNKGRNKPIVLPTYLWAYAAPTWAKLTDDDVLVAKQLVAGGLTQTEVARRLNVSPALISMIVRGRRRTYQRQIAPVH